MLERFRRRLFWKYLAVVLLLVGGVLTLSTAVDLYFSYEEAKLGVVALEGEKAVAAAYRIEQFVTSIEREVRVVMSAAALGSAAMSAQPESHTAGLLFEQRYVDFLRVLRNVPAITALRHLDSSGTERLSVSVAARSSTRQDYATAPFLITQARKSSSARSSYATNGPLVATVAGRRHRRGQSELDLGRRRARQQTGYAYIVDAGGRIIAHPTSGRPAESRLSGTPQVTARLATGGAEAARVIRRPRGRKVLAVFAPIPHCSGCSSTAAR
jgi:hypothetical protein